MRSNDAVGAAAELGASQHGALTRSQATRIGLMSREIRRLIGMGLVREPVPGLLVFTSTPPTPRQVLWLATHACGGGFVAAFESAAWLHGMDGFEAAPPPEVVGGPGRRIRAIDGLIQHAGIVTLPDLVEVDAIPCTSLARTVCDVTAKRGRQVGLRVLDDFERRGHSLRWLTATADRLHRPGQSGTRLVRQLLAERSGRAPDSWFERLVAWCLQLPGLPPWTRQHEVHDADARLVGRIDLACVPLRLGVEAHSKRFHFGARAEFDDQERDDELAAVGWDVRYVGWYAASRSPEQVARRIDKVARRRAHDLGITLPWVAAREPDVSRGGRGRR